MQGVQHVVESRGIGVNVHLPSVALKTFVEAHTVIVGSSCDIFCALAVYCEHVQMGEGSFGFVREFLE